VCHLEIARTGLRERDAKRAGFAYVTVTVRSGTKAAYFPGTQQMTVKMIAERRTLMAHSGARQETVVNTMQEMKDSPNRCPSRTASTAVATDVRCRISDRAAPGRVAGPLVRR
jgi:hypothetical protein